jgi:hypothetical protein
LSVQRCRLQAQNDGVAAVCGDQLKVPNRRSAPTEDLEATAAPYVPFCTPAIAPVEAGSGR